MQGPNVWRTSSGQALVVIRAGPRSLRIRSNAQCACRLGPSVATSQAAGKVLVNLELSSSHPGHPSARLLETLLAAPAHSGLFFFPFVLVPRTGQICGSAGTASRDINPQQSCSWQIAGPLVQVGRELARSCQSGEISQRHSRLSFGSATLVRENSSPNQGF